MSDAERSALEYLGDIGHVPEEIAIFNRLGEAKGDYQHQSKAHSHRGPMALPSGERRIHRAWVRRRRRIISPEKASAALTK